MSANPSFRGAVGLLTVAVVVLAAPAAPGTAAPAPAVAPALGPVHALAVTGVGVGSYPAFDPAIERYAVTTSPSTGGTVTVQATTSDPGGVVRVDGRVAQDSETTLTGLAAGDEVSVVFADAAGVEVHSLVYLPAGFPTLEAVASDPLVMPGQIGLTMFTLDPQLPQFATTVDRNGVPLHVEQMVGTGDLKQQPDGSITIAEPTTHGPGRTGWATVVRDNQWREVARYETVGLTDTDQHDSILLPDGSRFLLAYEPNGVTGRTDAVVQEVDSAGAVVFQWSSAGLEQDSARPATDPDYAHVNSIQVVGSDRDIVVSFRHFSAVYRIATRDHDSYVKGQVVWRLGGRHSDFTFVNDPLDGPCAQHTARVLANGDLLLFDDGSGGIFAPALCIDQSDAQGAPFTRTQSRAVEYALDPVHGTATEVWDYTPAGRYTPFMGSTARLGNGDTLIGWGASTQALATEVDAQGALLWELRAAPGSPPYISYRASLMNVPDAILPAVAVSAPEDGVHVPLHAPLTTDFSCTDRGGSSLRTCGGGLSPGTPLDTSTPGLHTFHVTATDGAGNSTVVTRSYTVDAAYQPRWADERVHRSLRGTRVTTKVQLVNDGNYADRFTVDAGGGNARFTVAYLIGHTVVTRAVRHGRFVTDPLQPGESLVLRVRVARTDRTARGDHRTFGIHATSLGDPGRAATVGVAVTARG